MRFAIRAGVALVGAALFVFPAVAGPPDASNLWARLSGPAESILERRQDAWTEDGPAYDRREQRSHRLNRLLDKAVAQLAVGDAVDIRRQIAERRTAITDHERRIADLRGAMAGLPEDSCDGAGPDASFIMRQIACVAAASRPAQRRRIAAEQQAITQAQGEIEALQARFVGSLAELGIPLTPEQADALLRVATAADIIGMHAVYANLRRVNDELLRATVEADETMEVARRYYGFYTVLLEVALHMHEAFLAKVREEHMPRLDTIARDAAAARADAERLRARARDLALRGQLDGNVKALDLTLKAVALYRQTLEGQERTIAESWRRIAQRHEVAVNTWRTVQASADILALMNESGRSFDTLLRLDVPALRPFDNLQLQREFDRLTKELTVPSS